VGVEDVNKVLPIIGALATYLPHLQALSASSPFWAGDRTGYASNRALVFQQLPTAGLPWPLADWAQYEGYLDDMVRTGVMEDATEVRWDIRPAPRWGTIEVRACDGMSTLPELAAVAALVQVLVEHFSRELDEGRPLEHLQPWFVRENKWRAARYGLEARVIVDRAGTQRPVLDHLAETVERLRPIAEELHCAREFAGIERIAAQGASYARQLAVADASGSGRARSRSMISATVPAANASSIQGRAAARREGSGVSSKSSTSSAGVAGSARVSSASQRSVSRSLGTTASAKPA
jgi:carboxylate-amine ligase